jgi:hypothetical protein
MTSDRPNEPNRDRSTRITAIVCGVLVVSGAIAALELSRRLEMDTQTSAGQPAPATAIAVSIAANPITRIGG